MKRLILSAAIFCTPIVAAANQEEVMSRIDARYDQTADIARKLWEWAEVGYQEERSSRLLQETLEAEGFAIRVGVADMPTAFVAEYGAEGPVIAILAEFDALPGINQDALPTRAPIEGKLASHACGPDPAVESDAHRTGCRRCGTCRPGQGQEGHRDLRGGGEAAHRSGTTPRDAAAADPEEARYPLLDL